MIKNKEKFFNLIKFDLNDQKEKLENILIQEDFVKKYIIRRITVINYINLYDFEKFNFITQNLIEKKNTEELKNLENKVSESYDNYKDLNSFSEKLIWESLMKNN